MRTFVEAIIITSLAACLMTCCIVGSVMAYEPCLVRGWFGAQPAQPTVTQSAPIVFQSTYPTTYSTAYPTTSIFSPAMLPTPYIVSRSAEVRSTGSIPVIVGAPMRQVIRSYESPITVSVCSDVQTSVYDLERMPKEVMVDRRPLIPLQNEYVSPLEPILAASTSANLVPLIDTDKTPEITAGMERTRAMTVEPNDVVEPTMVSKIVIETEPLDSVVTKSPSKDMDLFGTTLLDTRRLPSREEIEIRPERIPPQQEHKMVVPPMSPTFLGQVSPGFSGTADEVMSQRPPLPDGPADLSSIPKLLLDVEEPILSDLPQIEKPTGPANGEKGPKPDFKEAGTGLTGAKVNGALWIVTIASIMMTIYVLVIAYDYYQRWIQSLTMQNRRYALPWEDDASLGGAYNDVSDYYGDIPDYGAIPGDSFTGRFDMSRSDMRNDSYRPQGR